MIANDDIGNLGRLGNQMFQYAALRGIAAKHNYEYCLPPVESFGLYDPNCRLTDTNIFDCFELSSSKIGITNYSKISEECFEFDETLYNTCPDNISLFGYFQSEKYFENIEDIIRKEFTFKEDIYNISSQFFSQLSDNREVISLHIRRGDYLVNPNHPVQDLVFHQNALSHFDENLPILLFSDDPQWCLTQDIFSSDRFFVSEGGDTRVDLCLMSMCDYHIIANSSYSWWGSYLANSKKTIAPSNWFGGEIKNNKTTKDLYRKNWIII